MYDVASTNVTCTEPTTPSEIITVSKARPRVHNMLVQTMNTPISANCTLSCKISGYEAIFRGFPLPGNLNV